MKISESENPDRLRDKKLIAPANFSVRDQVSDAGSPALEKFTALENATVVQRSLEAGAVLAGRAATAEFGFGLNGDACLKNFTSQAADLAFMADLAGEPRYAAAAGGRFGFKPSHGTVSRAGLIGLMPSLEAVGLLGNHPADVAAAMAEIAGFDGKDFSLEAEPLAGFPVRPPKTESKPVLGRPAGCEARLSPAAREIFSAGLKKLEGAGFPVREVPWPGDETFRDLHRVIGSVEASSSCGKFDGVRYGLRADSANNWNDMYLKTRAASFSTFLKTLLFQGAFFQFESYGTFERAARIRARLIREIGQLFETVDLIISPVRPETPAAESAREVDQTYAAFSLTLPANVTGCPALAFSLSGGREASDPGLQVMGGFRSDAFLLACGKRLFETLTGGA